MTNPILFINKLKNILENHSNNTAFHIDGFNYSYQEFYKKVNGIAHKISSKSQQKIVVATNNDIETYASIIAIWITGNIYIPLNIDENRDRLKSTISILSPDLILSSKTVENASLDTIKTYNTHKLSSTDTFIFPYPHKSDIAYVLFTSGTTGVPKGVTISYQNLDAFVDSFFSLNYNVNENDNFLQMADLTFDMSIISFLTPLCIGAKVTTISNHEIKYLATAEALTTKNITVLITVPSTLQLLQPYYSEINIEQLKYTFVGAEAFYNQTAIAWHKCAPNSEIINLYGPSEGGILTSTYQWGSEQSEEYQGIVSIGKKVKNVNIYLVDEEGNIITDKAKGEAWIYGNQVFANYLTHSDNEGKFGKISINGNIEQCYKTGDILYRNDEGNLFYCGRKDDQVKIQGQRVELGEIEFYASKLSSKFKPVAICYNQQFGGDKIALFVEANTDKTVLLQNLKENLPSYMIPSKIIELLELPLNSNLKTDKKALQLILEKD